MYIWHFNSFCRHEKRHKRTFFVFFRFTFKFIQRNYSFPSFCIVFALRSYIWSLILNNWIYFSFGVMKKVNENLKILSSFFKLINFTSPTKHTSFLCYCSFHFFHLLKLHKLSALTFFERGLSYFFLCIMSCLRIRWFCLIDKITTIEKIIINVNCWVIACFAIVVFVILSSRKNIVNIVLVWAISFKEFSLLFSSISAVR